MSSNDVGSYEFKRSPWMQTEKCSARLARSTSDGSPDTNDNDNDNNSNDDYDNYRTKNPPTHQRSSMLGQLFILPFASMVTA